MFFVLSALHKINTKLSDVLLGTVLMYIGWIFSQLIILTDWCYGVIDVF